MSKTILAMAAVVLFSMSTQVFAIDYSGIYLNSKNGGDVEIKKNGQPNDEYDVHVTVVPPGTAIIGEVTFATFFSGGTAVYAAEDCWLKLYATGKFIKIEQDSSKGNCGAGMNATFDGNYKKKNIIK